MPRFYFDIDDGREPFRDDLGFDLGGPQEARDHAVAALPEIAREQLADSDRRVFTSKVRDQDGRVVLIAVLSLVTEWVM